MERIDDLLQADKEGRVLILPSKNDEVIYNIEVAMGFKLYDWQKAYILGLSDYRMPGRQTGKTTAYMLKIILSEGDPIHLYANQICDEYHGPESIVRFKHELYKLYWTLSNPGLELKLRKIYFFKREYENERSKNEV